MLNRLPRGNLLTATRSAKGPKIRDNRLVPPLKGEEQAAGIEILQDRDVVLPAPPGRLGDADSTDAAEVLLSNGEPLPRR